MNLFKRNDDDTLKPAGKPRGEMEGEYKFYYLAVDKSGNVFRNNLLYDQGNPYEKWKGWEQVSSKELAKLLQHLSFIKKKQKNLKR